MNYRNIMMKSFSTACVGLVMLGTVLSQESKAALVVAALSDSFGAVSPPHGSHENEVKGWKEVWTSDSAATLMCLLLLPICLLDVPSDEASASLGLAREDLVDLGYSDSVIDKLEQEQSALLKGLEKFRIPNAAQDGAKLVVRRGKEFLTQDTAESITQDLKAIYKSIGRKPSEEYIKFMIEKLDFQASDSRAER